MSVPTPHYFSTQSCKLRHLYCGTCFCVPSSKKVNAKPFRKSYLSLISLSFSTLWTAKYFLRCRNTSDHSVQGWDCMQHAWKFPTWTVSASTFFLIMHICPAFFEQLTHFLTFPSFTAPSSYTWTICLWISTRLTFLALKNCIVNCTSEVLECSFSCLNFDYNNWGKKIKTPYYTKNLFPLMTDLHRICTHHLHGQYLQLVLTFWTYVVHTGTSHLTCEFHSANLYVTWILHGGIQPTTHHMRLYIYFYNAHTCLCVCVLFILYLSTEILSKL